MKNFIKNLDLTKVLIISNLILLSVVSWFLFFKKDHVVDNTKQINDVAEQGKKSIKELKDSIDKLEEDRKKNFQIHIDELNQIKKDHDARLIALEKKKVDTAAGLVKKYKGDMPGLARELSGVTGIKVREK